MMELQPQLSDWLLQTFGEGVWDDSPDKTAARWLKALQEFTPIAKPDWEPTTFKATAKQMITVFNIEFASLCCHHLFPFFGKAHVAYISGKLQIGVSKIPRLVDWLARRPTTQETLCANIADYMSKTLDPQGVMVVIESTHTCMSCRGVRKVGASMTTSLPKGQFLTSPPARDEFLQLLQRSRV